MIVFYKCPIVNVLYNRNFKEFCFFTFTTTKNNNKNNKKKIKLKLKVWEVRHTCVKRKEEKAKPIERSFETHWKQSTMNDVVKWIIGNGIPVTWTLISKEQKLKQIFLSQILFLK